MSALPSAARKILWLQLCLTASTLFSADGFKDWKRQAAIKAPAARFVAISLTPELLDACDQANLADLRLVDPKGSEVPYAVIREMESREEVELAGQVLNRENPTPEASRLTVDFGSSVVKNRISVVTAGSNFRRRVRVDGSSDQADWAEVLPEGWLFAVAAGPRFETLDLGPNSYRFVRVTVSKMLDEERAPVIEAVQCRHVIVRKPAETERAAVLQSYATAPGSRESIALIDLGLRHLPVARLKLSLASDPLRVFRRQCVVFGRNSLVEESRVRFETDEYGGVREVESPWRHLGSGTIFRDAASSESLELSLEAPCRYLRIVVENGDSPPLDVSGVAGILHPVHVVFEPAGHSQFLLYCGNSGAKAPSYEATSTLTSLDVRGLPRCEVAALVVQAGAQKETKPEGQAAVWVCMGVVVAATLALLWWTAVSGLKSPPGSPLPAETGKAAPGRGP